MNNDHDTFTRPRTITINLTDETCDQLAAKAASHGLRISELMENFINDLGCKVSADITDSQMAARNWYDLNLFSIGTEDSLLRWMYIEKINVIKFLDNLHNLNINASDFIFSELHLENESDTEKLKIRLSECQRAYDAVITRYLASYPTADIESEIQKCCDWLEEYELLMCR